MRFAPSHNPRMPVSEPTDVPVVSILVAARNEEANILNCLRALAHLVYPDGAVEILIGNDGSTDQTAPLVADFIVDKPNFRLVSLLESPSPLQGKARVLAQLARQARGEWFFFTDADTQVPPTWLTEMIQQANPVRASSPVNTSTLGKSMPGESMPGESTPGESTLDIITGVTLPSGQSVFHQLQTMDWLYNLTLTHWLSALRIPVTAMGNNMAVSRVAYTAVGGYENLPFSVTEDYTLFRAVVSKGYRFQNRLDERVLAITRPVDTLRDWLEQRKRWMRGASELPVWLVALLYVQYLMGPLLLLLGWFSPALAVGLYVVRLFLQATVLSFGLARLRRTSLWPFALLFEPYQLLLGPLAVAWYWLSGPVRWKGRQFD